MTGRELLQVEGVAASCSRWRPRRGHDRPRAALAGDHVEGITYAVSG